MPTSNPVSKPVTHDNWFTRLIKFLFVQAVGKIWGAIILALCAGTSVSALFKGALPATWPSVDRVSIILGAGGLTFVIVVLLTLTLFAKTASTESVSTLTIRDAAIQKHIDELNKPQDLATVDTAQWDEIAEKETSSLTTAHWIVHPVVHVDHALRQFTITVNRDAYKRMQRPPKQVGQEVRVCHDIVWSFSGWDKKPFVRYSMVDTGGVQDGGDRWRVTVKEAIPPNDKCEFLALEYHFFGAAYE